MKIIALLLFFMLPVCGLAQDDVPVSPAQAALEAARVAARDGDQATAVRRLQELADSGFTGVNAITSDPELSKLAGNADYDRLVEKLTAVAYPCEHDPEFRAFDFWVGNWNVTLPDGRTAGRNRITREQRGCVLVEHWDSASGGSGMSVNYLDKSDGRWVQIWNDPSGNQIAIRGGLTDKGMHLSGTIHYVATGETYPFRGLWTPLEDGRVRQYFEQSGDDGETWQPWFEGFYARQVDDEQELN
jgi:hypothetical protein